MSLDCPNHWVYPNRPSYARAFQNQGSLLAPESHIAHVAYYWGTVLRHHSKGTEETWGKCCIMIYSQRNTTATITKKKEKITTDISQRQHITPNNSEKHKIASKYPNKTFYWLF